MEQTSGLGDIFCTRYKPSKLGRKEPTAEQIIAALKEQTGRVDSYFNGKLKNKATSPMTIATHDFQTVEALLQFATWHEGTHIGMIKSLNNAVK